MSKPFFDYVGRCQYLLRSGRYCADVLFYNGDVTPNLVAQKHVDPSLGKGYDYDVCNEEVLLTRLSCRYGKLVLPDGMSYEVLALPDATRMPLEVLKKIAQLVKDGATVVGPRPVEDSGLLNYPRCDEDVKVLSALLWGPIDGKTVTKHRYGAGTIGHGVGIREILAQKNIRPDFEYSGGEDIWLDFIHRTTPEADIYFITNRHGRAVRSDCSFRIINSSPQLWNPVDGQQRAKINYRQVDNRLIVPLRFDAFQSWFVVFPKNTGITTATTGDNFPELRIVQELTGEWDVAFDTHWGGPAHVRFDRLWDWSQSDDGSIRYYSGKAVYTKVFDYADTAGGPVYLDLGVVKNIARVALNDQDLGIVWTAPWQVELSPALKSGSNHLKIEVINLWPNRLIGDAGLPPEKRLTTTNIPFKKDTPLTPSGLLGPVTLKQGPVIPG
jgi:hypothetical protein